MQLVNTPITIEEVAIFRIILNQGKELVDTDLGRKKVRISALVIDFKNSDLDIPL